MSLAQRFDSFPDGARVKRVYAEQFDLAYHNTGTVVREIVDGSPVAGVQWDGSETCYQYPANDWFVDGRMV